MLADRREFLQASFGNALKLAGFGALASLARTERIRGTPLCQDEDGYLTSPEAHRQEEEREKEVLPLGSPAPAWLRNAEVYNGWYAPWSEDALQTWLKDFPLIIGVPHVKSWIDRAHQLGIRVIPYISFYKSLNVPMAQRSGRESFNTLPSPFWNALDLSKHPEWLLYNKEGKVRRPFGDPTYPPEWEEVCTASPGFAEAALKGVQALLELGFDGLFIDNVHPTPHCYGPVFGKHSHVNGLDNAEAFRKLLSFVYVLVKKWSSDNIVVLNPGHVEPSYWSCADAMMYESYICTTPDGGYTCSKGWSPILQKEKNSRRAIRDGKVVLALSYMGTTFYGMRNPGSHETAPQPPNKEDVFYSYACARLSGFLWSDYFSLPRNDPAQVLYTLRLGRLAGDMEEFNGVYLRRFQHGVVAVNPSGETKRIQIPRIRMLKLRDIYAGKVIEVSGGSLQVDLPGQSGRVYCSSAA